MSSEATQLEKPAVAEYEAPKLAGLMAEFEDVDSVIHAAAAVRDAGFTRWDVHSPFPIHGIDAAMGIRPTVLPWIVLCGGLIGLAGGLALQWFTNGYDYPFLISGKPIFDFTPNIPVAFETTVLCSAFAAVFGMFGLNRLPMLYNPLFKSERFRRVTNDRFFIVLDASDPKFNEARSASMLLNLGAKAVEQVLD